MMVRELLEPAFWGYFAIYLGMFLCGYQSWRWWSHYYRSTQRLFQLRRLSDDEADDEGLHLSAGVPIERFASDLNTAKKLASVPWWVELASLLEKSGDATKVDEYLKATAIFTVCGAILGGMFMGAAGIMLGAIVGGFGLYVRLQAKVAKREREFNIMIPEALAMLGMYLKAGQSLPQALGSVAQELPEPIGPEFQRAVDEYNAGRTIVEALRGVTHRFTKSESMRYFLLGVSVLDEAGGNLVQVIESVQESTRIKQNFEQKVKALTSESRGGAKVLGGLPIVFAAMVSFVNPAYARVLIEEPAGWVVIGLMVVLWAAGLLTIRTILNAEG